jgi:hypothetical protein
VFLSLITEEAPAQAATAAPVGAEIPVGEMQ